MNFLKRIPPKARLYVYLAFALVSLVLTYFSRKGVVGPDEIQLWTGIGALLGLTAASNVERR